MDRAIYFLGGVAYGIGLYIVLDYLAFGRWDPAGAAERILREADDAA